MAQKTLSIRELVAVMSFPSEAFDNIYNDICQGKYKEVVGGDVTETDRLAIALLELLRNGFFEFEY